MSTPPPPPPGQVPPDFPPAQPYQPPQPYHPQPLVPPGQAPPPPPPYQPQFQPGYPPQGYGMQPVQQKTNGLSIASFVLGLATIVTWCVPITPVLAVIFGFVARGQLKRNPVQQGKGLATAGIIIGFVFIVLIAAFWIWVASTGNCHRDGNTFRCGTFDS